MPKKRSEESQSQHGASKKQKSNVASSSSSAASAVEMDVDPPERKTRSATQDDEKATLHNDLIDRAILNRNIELSLEQLEVLPLRAIRASGVSFLVEEIRKKGWLGSLSPLYVQKTRGSTKFRVIEGNHRVTALMQLQKEGFKVKPLNCVELKQELSELEMRMISNVSNTTKELRVPVALTDLITELRGIEAVLTQRLKQENSRARVTNAMISQEYKRFRVDYSENLIQKVRQVEKALGDDGLAIISSTLDTNMNAEGVFHYSALINSGLVADKLSHQLRIQVLERMKLVMATQKTVSTEEIKVLIGTFRAIQNANEMFEQDIKREKLESFIDKKALEKIKEELRRGKHDAAVSRFNEGRLPLFTVLLNQARKAKEKAELEKKKAEAEKAAEEAASRRLQEAKEQLAAAQNVMGPPRTMDADTQAQDAAASIMVHLSQQKPRDGALSAMSAAASVDSSAVTVVSVSAEGAPGADSASASSSSSAENSHSSPAAGTQPAPTPADHDSLSHTEKAVLDAFEKCMTLTLGDWDEEMKKVPEISTRLVITQHELIPESARKSFAALAKRVLTADGTVVILVRDPYALGDWRIVAKEAGLVLEIPVVGDLSDAHFSAPGALARPRQQYLFGVIMRKNSEAWYWKKLGCSTFSTKPSSSCGINNIVPQKKRDKLTYLDGSTVHPTEPPLSFVEALVARHSEPRDIVIDPFMGSGIVAVACINLLRRFRGVDSEQKRFDRVTGHLRQCYKNCVDRGSRSLSEDLSVPAPEDEKLSEVNKLKFVLRRSPRHRSKDEAADDDDDFDDIKAANNEFIARACAGVLLTPPYFDATLSEADMLDLEAAQQDLVIKESTIDSAGKGCFTLKALAKGTKVMAAWGTFYSGTGRSVVEDQDEKKSNYELLAVPGYSELILAMHPSSCARYINDGCRSSKEPNVVIEMDYTVESAADFKYDTLSIVASKDIAAGEELLTEYGDNYWSHFARQKRKQH